MQLKSVLEAVGLKKKEEAKPEDKTPWRKFSPVAKAISLTVTTAITQGWPTSGSDVKLLPTQLVQLLVTVLLLLFLPTKQRSVSFWKLWHVLLLLAGAISITYWSNIVVNELSVPGVQTEITIKGSGTESEILKRPDPWRLHNEGMKDADILWKLHGDPEAVWTEESLNKSHNKLVGLYIIGSLLLSLTLISGYGYYDGQTRSARIASEPAKGESNHDKAATEKP